MSENINKTFTINNFFLSFICSLWPETRGHCVPFRRVGERRGGRFCKRNPVRLQLRSKISHWTPERTVQLRDLLDYSS